MFTIILCKTEPVTEVYFEHTLGIHIYLPVPLHEVALFSLIFGVFIVQAIPGIALLATNKHMPAALKLNEFLVLLGMIELETASNQPS